jgi:class 3 adenylate cyclase
MQPNDDHAERCAAAALEMLEFMPFLRTLADSDIHMRVGIHCGFVTAGVVGCIDPRCAETASAAG